MTATGLWTARQPKAPTQWGCRPRGGAQHGALFAWANRLMLNLGEAVFPQGD